jgi:hypothetical protein
MAALVLAALALDAVAGAAPAPAAGRQAGLLAMVAQTPAVEADGAFELRLRVTGAPPGSELVVTVHNRVLNRGQFVDTTGGERLRGRLFTTRLQLDETPQDSAGTILIRVPTRTGPGSLSSVRLSRAGVYPVVVDLDDVDGGRLDTLVTHLTRLPAPGEEVVPLRMGLVVPFHAPPAHRPDGTVEVDGESRRALVTVSSVLQRHPDTPLTIVPTPETVEALAADPASLDASLLESFRRAIGERQVVATPYVRVEPTAWLGAGLAPTLATLFDRGLTSTLSQLAVIDSSTYVAGAGLDTTAAAWLRDRGANRLVVPESTLAPLNSEAFPVTLTQRFRVDGVEGVEALMADASLARHVGASGDPVLDAYRVLADLAVLYFDAPVDERGVTLVLPADPAPEPAFLETLLAGVDAVGVVRPTDLETIFEEVPLASAGGEDAGASLVRALQPGAPAGLGDLPTRLAAVHDDLATFDLVVGSPSAQAVEMTRLVLVACAADLSNGERAAYLQGVASEIDRQFDHIELPDRQTFTLTARQGVVPIVIRNTAGFPMSVRLRLAGERLEFPDLHEGLLQLQLTEEVTRVEVNVRTLASGDAPLDLTVLTPDGRHELARSRFRVRSTAVSGVGVAALVGSGLFLAAWWGANVHRTRRNRRLMPTTEQEPVSPSG